MNIVFIPYGTAPSRERFNRGFLEARNPNHFIRFKEDSRLGNSELSSEEFFLEIKKAIKENSTDSLIWACSMLHSISIEWAVIKK